MIKKTIVCLFVLLTTKFLMVHAVTTNDIPSYAPPREKTISEIIDEKALQYGVSAELVHYIVKKESQYNPKAIGDMNLICKRTGKPVRARGILQITECWYPDVSDACAFDVECSLDRMLPVMKTDCESQWSTCQKSK